MGKMFQVIHPTLFYLFFLKGRHQIQQIYKCVFNTILYINILPPTSSRSPANRAHTGAADKE
jgi:hypothetical protein